MRVNSSSEFPCIYSLFLLLQLHQLLHRNYFILLPPLFPSLAKITKTRSSIRHDYFLDSLMYSHPFYGRIFYTLEFPNFVQFHFKVTIKRHSEILVSINGQNSTLFYIQNTKQNSLYGHTAQTHSCCSRSTEIQDSVSVCV